MSYFKNIVVALDFSRTSEDALHVACEVAAGQPAQLHLLHVVADARHQPTAMETPDAGFDDLQRKWISDAEARLADLARDADQSMVIRRVVEGAPVADAIADYALGNQADLIVVGTHGYGPVTRFLLGSVSDQLLRRAPCPVLTVPPIDLRPEASLTSISGYVGS